jgi:hypothetical protein
VFIRDGEEQWHPAIFEAVAPPPARNKASDPGATRYLGLPVDDCRVVTVMRAVYGKVGRVLDPLVDRIDIFPMTPFPAYLRIAVPSVMERQDLWCDTRSPSDARHRIERRDDNKNADQSAAANCPISPARSSASEAGAQGTNERQQHGTCDTSEWDSPVFPF